MTTPDWTLDWTEDTATLPDTGMTGDRQANSEDLRTLALALGVTSVERLATSYSIQKLGGDRVRLTGKLAAVIVQPCGVTLEPVQQAIDEPLTGEFWPAGQMPAESRLEVEIGPEDEPEPLVGTLVPLGRLVYETLAAAIDPFPRAPGAELGALETRDTPAQSPFSVLAKLKQPPGSSE